MSLSRRDLLIAGAGVSAAGCSRLLNESRQRRNSAPIPAPSGVQGHAHRMNRLGYGAHPSDFARIEEMGWSAFVDSQLSANQPEPEELQVALHAMDIFHFGTSDLRALPEHHVQHQLQRAAILRAIYSPNQLKERMVEFWSDHFNIDSGKDFGAFHLALDQKSVIRKHALGRFPEMLAASAKSPAMLGYLDNKVNKKGVVNENYARELLELHSMGIYGGYSQQDVREVARCFTGWGVENRFLKAGGTFRFNDEIHDNGEKVVLGRRIAPGGGVKDGEIVLELVSMHPSTAKHLAHKLCERIVGTADPELVNETAEIYLRTQGDIQQMLRHLLSQDALDRSHPTIKRPFDHVVSSLRALDVDAYSQNWDEPILREMGQPLYRWAMPDGYPVKTSAWGGSLIARWNFALGLAHGTIPNLKVDLDNLSQRLGLGVRETIAFCLFGDSNWALTGKTPADQLALGLSSPAFQWR